MHLDPHGLTIFGDSVAINTDCIAVKGAIYQQRLVSLYCEHAGFRRTQVLTGDPGTSFGHGIAFANDVLVVGVPDVGLLSTGKVYVYVRSVARGLFVLKTSVSAPAGLSGFGHALSADASTFVIGAPRSERNGVSLGGIGVLKDASGVPT